MVGTPNPLDKLRQRMAVAIAIVYTAAIGYNAIDHTYNIPSLLNIAVGAVVAWLYSFKIDQWKKNGD